MLENPPVIARNTRGPRLVRFGVFGSLSATSSPSARRDRTMVAALEPRKDSLEPLRSSHPRCAAQLTSAGAVSERNPTMIPMEKHPRYRTALPAFMPAHFSRKRALVKKRLKSMDPCRERHSEQRRTSGGTLSWRRATFSFLCFRRASCPDSPSSSRALWVVHAVEAVRTSPDVTILPHSRAIFAVL